MELVIIETTYTTISWHKPCTIKCTKTLGIMKVSCILHYAGLMSSRTCPLFIKLLRATTGSFCRCHYIQVHRDKISAVEWEAFLKRMLEAYRPLILGAPQQIANLRSIHMHVVRTADV